MLIYKGGFNIHRFVIVVGKNAPKLDYISAQIFSDRLGRIHAISERDLGSKIPYWETETLIITDDEFNPASLSRDTAVVSVGGPIVNRLSRELVQKLKLEINDNHPGKEAFLVRTLEESGYLYILTAGSDKRGTLYALGKLLRCLRVEDDGLITVPELNIFEKPVMGLRGTDIQFRMGHICANPYTVWCVNGQFHKLRIWLEDLALWGLNTVEFCVGTCSPELDNAWEGESAKYWETWLKMYDVARSLELDIVLLLCGNLVPHSYVERFPDLKAEEWFWSHGNPPRKGPGAPAFCPSKEDARKELLKTKEWYINNVPEYNILHIFPRDDGGCGCSLCSPDGYGRGYYRTYLKLTTELIEIAKKYNPSSELMVNLWLFDRDEINEMIPLILKSPEISYVGAQIPFFTEVSTHPGWGNRHDFPPLLPLTRKLCQEKKVVIWPDVTMFGGWGTFGPYPIPRHINRLFEIYKGAYGVIPYSEGPYDRINQLFMLSLAWNPDRDIRDVVKEVLTGMFNQPIGEDLIDAIFLMEEYRLDEALNLLTRAEEKITVQSIDQLSNLLLLKSWCKYASIPIAIIKLEKRCKEILVRGMENGMEESKGEVNILLSDFEKLLNQLKPSLRKMQEDMLILFKSVQGMDESIAPSTTRMLWGPRPITDVDLENVTLLSEAKDLVSNLKSLLKIESEDLWHKRLKEIIERFPDFEYLGIDKPIHKWRIFQDGPEN